MATPEFVPLPTPYDPGEAPECDLVRLHDILSRRRSIRMFAARPVSREVVHGLVRAACTAPSGANKQPWRFVCIQDVALKREIRLAAEAEEREFYADRASDAWLADLEILGTDANKGFLEIAPWLIAVFRLSHDDDGSNVYYGLESVGIAVGMLLAAAQMAGLSTLTHTPSPMRFLGEILGRPKHEHPFALIPVGYPADGCVVPKAALRRKPIAEVMVIDRARRVPVVPEEPSRKGSAASHPDRA